LKHSGQRYFLENDQAMIVVGTIKNILNKNLLGSFLPVHVSEGVAMSS